MKILISTEINTFSWVEKRKKTASFREQNQGAIWVLVCAAAAVEYKIPHSYLHYRLHYISENIKLKLLPEL